VIKNEIIKLVKIAVKTGTENVISNFKLSISLKGFILIIGFKD
jgi:hypothetical protein